MKFKEFAYLIKSDLYRYGEIRISHFLRNLLFTPGFKYSFWMRLCAYFKQHRLYKYTLFCFSRYLLYRYTFKLGIAIPYTTQIGSGFYIGHFGGIIVSPDAIIGKNCNISQGVTLGRANRGKRKGSPVLGDNIYIGAGAKIIGGVKVGNNVAVGANCVLVDDVPDNAVVVGIPGKVISFDGSEGYVNRTDYDSHICK